MRNFYLAVPGILIPPLIPIGKIIVHRLILVMTVNVGIKFFGMCLIEDQLEYASAGPNYRRDMDRGGPRFPYQDLGDKSSLLDFECLQTLRSWESPWS